MRDCKILAEVREVPKLTGTSEALSPSFDWRSGIQEALWIAGDDGEGVIDERQGPVLNTESLITSENILL